MAKKNLLNEGTVRRWGMLAQIEPLVENFVKENEDVFGEGEETLEEDNYDASGPGPHREGTKKNSHSGESGVASNQGKEAPSSPDGKLEVPGTGYMADQKLKSQSPSKGNVSEQKLEEMPDIEGEDEGEMEDEMDGDVPPPPAGDMEEPAVDAPMDEPASSAGGMGMSGEVDLQSLVSAIAAAISQETGVEINVAGEASDVSTDMPPADDMAEPAVDASDTPMDEPSDMSADMPEEPDMGDEEEDLESKNMDAVVESIAKKVAARLGVKSPRNKRRR